MMRTMDQLKSEYRPLCDEYDAWLGEVSPKTVAKWRGELNSDGFEAAIIEAWTARFLRQHVSRLDIAEKPQIGGPDFICTQGSSKFYVEATCITLSTAKRHVRCDDFIDEVSIVGSLVHCIQNKVVEKQKQASRNCDAPTLVLIGTLHFDASSGVNRSLAKDVLQSHTYYAVPFEPASVYPSGYLATNLRHAAFVRIGQPDDSVNNVRQSISGLILCGVGCAPVEELPCGYNRYVVGLLNLAATNSFDRRLLPQIPFYKLDLETNPGHARVIDV